MTTSRNNKSKFGDFSAITLQLSSPEDILSNSYGEVVNNETINYRTLKPEKGGLFCAKVFGPVKDYECLCGKYKRMKYSGIVCEKCEVEVTTSSVRRERMGHINLCVPIVHIWFSKSQPSKLALALGITAKNVNRVVYYEAYIVIDPGSSTLEKYQVLSDDEYNEALDQFGDGSFTVGIGAEGMLEVLKLIDIKSEIAKLNIEFENTKSKIQKKNIEKRLLFFSNFELSGNKLEWMVMKSIPVLPPDLRPLVPLDGGKFATSDLNDLYRKVINRNSRLKRLIEIGAPAMIIKNEKRMLQYSVDTLFLGNGDGETEKKSLTEGLKGKTGRFRQNILGKRVDYSGRSVISVGPELKLYQCGLPIVMAIELFKPFIFSKLMTYGKTASIKDSEKFVQSNASEVIDILNDIVKDKVVLLNRAPTLHRLGIQGFEIKLINGKSIQLHPLVCKAFNADFDGDQMAVHVPLSIEAQVEARVLMLSSNNILNPSDGNPIISPTKDVVLGLFYATSIFNDIKQIPTVFDSLDSVESCLDLKQLRYNSAIKYKMKSNDGYAVIDTCPGRLMTYKQAGIPLNSEDFEIFNKIFNAKHLAEVVLYLLEKYGRECVVKFCDDVMRFGFEICTKSGISFGLDDVKIPESKDTLVKQSFEVVKEVEKQLESGLITYKEKYNKVTDEWSKCVDKVTLDLMNSIKVKSDTTEVNSVYLMINSGARGSEAQLKQMAGMKGLMVKPSGEVIESPIISNFKEGLNMMEYFNSAHGSRKGVSDTALKTANAGYLTRRLVDVAQDIKIVEHDCGTTDGIVVKPLILDGKVVKSLYAISLGRVIAEDVVSDSGEVLLKKGTMVDKKCKQILENVLSVKVRSVAVCKSKNGICAMCYGEDIARKQIATVGEAVGVIAAQAIGEPGTQLTLRTFQIGGVSSRSSSVLLKSEVSGVVKFENLLSVKSKDMEYVLQNNSRVHVISKKSGNILSTYILPRGAELFVQEGDSIEVGQKISQWSVYVSQILSEVDGFIKYVDLIEHVSYKDKFDEHSGISNKVVTSSIKNGKYLMPRIAIVDKDGEILKNKNGDDIFYLLPIEAIIQVEDGDEIKAGGFIARASVDVNVIQDITGGLPIVEGIFEARVPEKPSVIAPFDGIVRIDTAPKLKNRITIYPNDKTLDPVDISIKKDDILKVDNGASILKGDTIVDGEVDLHNVLLTHGEEELIRFMTNKIQSVYQLQGVTINEKHIEIIVKKMLSRCVITESGDSDFVSGDNTEVNAVDEINAKLEMSGKKPAVYRKVLTGITKVSVNMNSFIAAAAFQEVVKVLSSAACFGKTDHLVGCKENITVGRNIPLGTGFLQYLMLKNDAK